eukprot:jgi/Psemu1/67489/estExt_Genemark1.C_3270030
MSGLLGFRSSRKLLAPETPPLPREDKVEVEDDISIVSIAVDRPHRLQMESKTNGNRNSISKKTDAVPCAQSVMSDVSFNTLPVLFEDDLSDDDEFDNSLSDPMSTKHAFLVECNNGEQIYVPSWKGRLIKARCRHFRMALGRHSGSCTLVVGVGNSSNSTINSTISNSEEKTDLATGSETETYVLNNRVLHKKNWSPRTARHIIELLTDGNTWIEHESKHHRRFVELLKACDELSVRLCLGSVINYHDVLDPANSLRFFQLSGNTSLHRFRLTGTITSWQWVQLLRSGVLLHLNSTRVLMLSSRESDNLSERRTQQRLSKCDDLYSEFSVYSEKSTMNTLYTIFDLLSTTGLSNQTQKIERRGNKNEHRSGPSAVRSFDESFRIIFRTQKGALREDDINNLWRMTSASYTLSTPDESGFLLQLHRNRIEELPLVPPPSNNHPNQPPAPPPRPPHMDLLERENNGIDENDDDDDDDDDNDNDDDDNNDDKCDETSVVSGASTVSSYTAADSYLDDNESVDELPTRNIPVRHPTPPSATGIGALPFPPSSVTDADHHPNHESRRCQPTFETRTITGTSLVVLKHLFDPINNIPNHRHRFEPNLQRHSQIKYSNPSDMSPSLLPACLSISNPTPDTLGRFLNACTRILGSGSISHSEGAGGTAAAASIIIPKIGYRFVPPLASSTTKGKLDAVGTVFFVSGTSRSIKEVLAHMADYSQTSIVGDADFELEQFRRRRE